MGDHKVEHRLAELLVGKGRAVVTIELIDPWHAGNQKHVNQQQVGGNQRAYTSERVEAGRKVFDARETAVDEHHGNHGYDRRPGDCLD